MKFRGRFVLAVAVIVLAFGMLPLSIMAETDGELSVSGNALELYTEMTSENGLEAITGFCGDLSENEGKNVTYTITDSDGDGTYDLLNIDGKGRMRDYEEYGSVSPWRLKEKEVKKVIISKGVTSVGAYAFYSKIYSSQNSDGMYYPHSDSVLSEVTIPEGVTSIGDGAFYSCRLLSEVLIPNSVKSIGKGAFYGLHSLNTVIIPEGVIFIDRDAFSGCDSLKYLVIPESLASMGEAPCPFNTYSDDIIIFEPVNCPSIGYGPLNYPATATYKVDKYGNIIILCCSRAGSLDLDIPLSNIPDSLSDGRLVRYASQEDLDWLDEEGHRHMTGGENGFYPLSSSQEEVWHRSVEATCVKDGNCEYRKCFICKKNYIYYYHNGNWVQREIALEDTIIPATGHTGGNATCQQKAMCTTCGEEYGDLAEHNYVNNICYICGKSSSNKDTYPQIIIPTGPDTWRNKTGIEGFVYRLYNVALIRNAEDAGLSDWMNRLDTKKESAAEVARGFFFSDEFLDRNYTNEQYVEFLYRTMFGRDSDEGGKAYWLNCLENGASREYVYHGFAESQEFTGLCKDFGVDRGSVSLGQYRDQNIEATGFVARLYTKMLGRSFDDDGIEYWCEEYVTGKKSIEAIAADGFLHSPEFTGQNLSDKEFVTRMYETFLNREPDEAGLNDWVEKLKRGEITRDGLVYGFTNSPEFGKLKAEYNLP